MTGELNVETMDGEKASSDLARLFCQQLLFVDLREVWKAVKQAQRPWHRAMARRESVQNNSVIKQRAHSIYQCHPTFQCPRKIRQ